MGELGILLLIFTDLYYGSNKSTGKETGKSHLFAVNYSIMNSFGQRSQYISIKFPIDKQSENP